MTQVSPTIRYRLVLNVGWSVELEGLLVSDGRENIHWVPYPQAAVWDLISRGYSASKVCFLLTHIASLDSAAAEILVRESLEEWTRLGLLSKQ